MHGWHSRACIISCVSAHALAVLPSVSSCLDFAVVSYVNLQCQARHRIVLACFLATFTAYVERVGFSIAFTAMAKQAGLSEALKGTVLSAFFWGYAVSQARPATPTS